MHPDRLSPSTKYLIHGKRYRFMGQQLSESGKPLFIFQAAHPLEEPAVVPYSRILTHDQLILYVRRIRG